LSKLHFSSVLLLYYVRLSHILLNTVLLCYCVLLYVYRYIRRYGRERWDCTCWCLWL